MVPRDRLDFEVLVGTKGRGEAADSSPKNSMRVFFKRSAYSLDRNNKGTDEDVKAVDCVAERVLMVRLRRKGGCSIDLVAVHGKHDDRGFLEQAETVDGILNGGSRREVAFEQKRLEREHREERRWLAEAIL